MTTYEQIRQIRNKHFKPKLEVGAEVEIKSDKYFLEISDNGLLENKVFIYQGFCMRGTDLASHKFGWGYDYSDYIVYFDAQRNWNEEIIILGNTVTLVDVLRMINTNNTVLHTSTSEDKEKFGDEILYINDNIAYNLTLPLKDQSEKTLLQILSLIK